MKCTMVFSSSAAALPGRREWAGGQPAVTLTLVNILSFTADRYSAKYANTEKGLSKFLHLPVDCQSLPPWPSPAELVNLKNI